MKIRRKETEGFLSALQALSGPFVLVGPDGKTLYDGGVPDRGADFNKIEITPATGLVFTLTAPSKNIELLSQPIKEFLFSLIEKKQLTLHTLGKYRELDVLSEISREMGAEVDSDIMASDAAKKLDEVLNVESVLIFELPEGGSVPKPLGLAGKSASRHIKTAATAATMALKTQKTIMVNSPQDAINQTIELQKTVRNLISVRLMSENRPVGALSVLNKQDGSFSSEDESLLNTVGVLIAEKIENARLLKSKLKYDLLNEELKIARRIQAGLLPKNSGRTLGRPEVDISSVMLPASEVGGDYYDVFVLDRKRLCMVMADVSGKGIAATLFMAVTKTLFDTLIKNLHQRALRRGGFIQPEKVLTDVNAELYLKNDDNMFVTLFCAILELDSGELRYANAGHDPPVLITPQGRAELVCHADNVCLGPFDDIRYTGGSMRLMPGQTLLLYTDGVTEAMDPEGSTYTAESLLEFLDTYTNASSGQTPEALTSGLMRSLDSHVRGAAQSDDITMLAVRYTGS